MKKHFLIFVVCLQLLLASCSPISQENNADAMATDQDEWQCIGTVDDFLYQMAKITRNDELYSLSDIYPSAPWELSAEIPETVYEEISNGLVTRVNIELVREYSGQTELWLRSDDKIIKHNAGTENFSIISPFPYDQSGKTYLNVIVRDLFEISTGEIIGVNYPQNNNTEWDQPIPVFSKYNEFENRFEFYDIGLPYWVDGAGYGNLSMSPQDDVIISKSDEVIWIYQQQDGLYSYNPMDAELKHYETSFDGIVQSMVPSPDGFLLFYQEKQASWKLLPGELAKYYPDLNTVEKIRVPLFRWPDYGTWLYTDSGDLWIGIHGYLSKDGTWVLKNPNRLKYIHLGLNTESYNWAHPKLIFQSSNGYLWYTNENQDFLGVDGSAWYDPTSDKGCWFTTGSGNIVEDNLKNLWMAIGDKIYKYSVSE